MKNNCPKCNIEFEPARWKKFRPQLSSRCCVCDNCIDDRIRHNIIENYFGYNKSTNVTDEDFDNLLYFMSLSGKKDFYNWFLRESSKFNLMSHSVYSTIRTASPYPQKIGPLLRYIYKKYETDFFQHLNGCWQNYSNSEQNSILHSFPDSKQFILYQDTIKLKNDLKSVVEIFNQLLKKSFKLLAISEEECCHIVRILKENTNLDSWYSFARKLTNNELKNLIKSLVRIENSTQLSTQENNSPIVPLCRYILKPHKKLESQSDFDHKATELINWILENSTNSYLPFGESNLSANSLEEYNELLPMFIQSNNEISALENDILQKKDNIKTQIALLQEKIVVLNNEINKNSLQLKHQNDSTERIAILKQLVNR